MWYKVNYNKLVVLLLPTFLRRAVIAGYLQALVAPLIDIQYLWEMFRTDNLYKLEHTGQVCSLRQALNDSCDSVLRRIYISSGNFYDNNYIYTEGELQDVFLYPEDDTEEDADTIWLRTEAETADTGLNFIVYVPQEVYDLRYFAVKAHVDFYKAGGKRYSIQVIP